MSLKDKKAAKSAQGKLSFSKAEKTSEDYTFFKFEKEGANFLGTFQGILPESANLEGISFNEINEETLEAGKVKVLVPKYSSLSNYFMEKEPSDTVVYRITLNEKLTLKGGKEFFKFEVESALIPDGTEEAE